VSSAPPRDSKSVKSRRRRAALATCPNCATLLAEVEALHIDRERLRQDRDAAFTRLDLHHGPDCGKLDRRRIEEAEAMRAQACVSWAMRQAERDRLRAALWNIVHTLRGDGDDTAKADAAYSVAAEVIRTLAPPSVHPASEPANAPDAPGDEALAKSAVADVPEE